MELAEDEEKIARDEAFPSGEKRRQGDSLGRVTDEEGEILVAVDRTNPQTMVMRFEEGM